MNLEWKYLSQMKYPINWPSSHSMDNMDVFLWKFFPPVTSFQTYCISTEFICGKLRSPDGPVMASLRRSPINGGVQFSPLSMLHLFCSAISIENNNSTSCKFQYIIVYNTINNSNKYEQSITVSWQVTSNVWLECFLSIKIPSHLFWVLWT